MFVSRGTWLYLLVGLLGACSAPEPEPGSSEPLARVAEPIVDGGVDTTTKAVVALTTDYGGTQYGFCSGSLLMPNLVLTARHCISEVLNDSNGVECNTTTFGYNYAAYDMFISVEDDIRTGANPALLYAMARVVPTDGNTFCGNDVGLIELKGNGIPDVVAKPFEPELVNIPKTGDKITAIGYGITDPNDTNGETYGQRMRSDDREVFCVGKFECGEYAVGNDFAADAPVCSGDSGGPAVNAAGKVTGVTSRGDDLCSIALYSEVSSFKSMIQDWAWTAALDTQTTAPEWAGEPPAGVGGSGGEGGAPVATAGTGGKPSFGGTFATGNAPSTGGSGGGEPMGPPGDIDRDAGNTDGTPTIDPLGAECAGNCPGSYACYSDTGSPPGICVPYCSDNLPACPAQYVCSSSLHACVPATPSMDRTTAGCGCKLPSHESQPSSLWTLAALGMLALGRARKRLRS